MVVAREVMPVARVVMPVARQVVPVGMVAVAVGNRFGTVSCSDGVLSQLSLLHREERGHSCKTRTQGEDTKKHI